MSAFLTSPESRLAELDAATREAWATYASSLRDLEGEAYEHAEVASWGVLQDRLAALQGERAAVAAAG
jgi:hypothetical protein